VGAPRKFLMSKTDVKHVIMASRKAIATPKTQKTQVRATPDQTEKVKLCRLLMPKMEQKQ
jgi:hypothetical protein